MSQLPATCPSCEAELKVTKIACTRCSTSLDGNFPLPGRLRLPADDSQFVVDFVLASGSLKAMAKQYRQSYPTIRNRLNTVSESISDMKVEGTKENKRAAILEAIAKGTLSVSDATKRMKEIEA